MPYDKDIDDMTTAIQTTRGAQGMVTAPHHLAARAGQRVLADGGDAIEAMVAMAASIAVVYPHMNSLGGDGFWVIKKPGQAPIAIDAAGPSAALANFDFYKEHSDGTIPTRGPLAALTVAGTIGGWDLALSLRDGEGLPLSRLLEDAVLQARDGFRETATQMELTATKRAELEGVPGFAATYMTSGPGGLFKQPALAQTLEHLTRAGLDDFYRGDLAKTFALGLEAVGSPLRLSDLQAYRAQVVEPLTVKTRWGQLYNMTPPTQGISSLMILGLFDRLGVTEGDSADHIHGLIEATKQAFLLRNAHLADGQAMTEDPRGWLKPETLDALAAKIDMTKAQPWPDAGPTSDTIWMGAIDKDGTAVSFIQSTYWEFGSGVVPPETGVVWQNRGLGFSLDPSHPNALAPYKRPFHTLNPALAELDDGRLMVYGTMGGEGQPQTQAAIFTRYAAFGQDLAQAVAAPRWLLGRTWGDVSDNLKVESDLDADIVAALKNRGHDIDLVPATNTMMGHAGAAVHLTDGSYIGANDPRSDGAALGV